MTSALNAWYSLMMASGESWTFDLNTFACIFYMVLTTDFIALFVGGDDIAVAIPDDAYIDPRILDLMAVKLKFVAMRDWCFAMHGSLCCSLGSFPDLLKLSISEYKGRE